MCPGETKWGKKGLYKKRWNIVEKMLARDMRNMKRKYVMWKKGRLLSKKQDWEQRQGWWDRWRDTREVSGGERDADKVKECVHIRWIKTTCVCLRWGHCKATHTCKEACRHLHPPGAPHASFQNLFLMPTFCCSQKLSTRHLHCVLHQFRLAKQINKYTLLFQGHLPSYSAC